MKILICNTNIYAGGAESVLRDLVNHLLTRGHDITILASPQNKNDLSTAFKSDVRFVRLRCPQVKNCHNILSNCLNSLISKFVRVNSALWLKFHRFDVGIAFLEGLTTRDGVNIRAGRKFAWVHCDLEYYHNIQCYKDVFPSVVEERKVYEHYDKVVCVSETARKGVIKAVGDLGNLCVRYNPINWKKIQTMAQEPCPFKKDMSRPLIVSVGSLTQVKNYGLLLEACNRLKDKCAFDLWIIGKGSAEAQLKEYIESNNLNNVKLLGFQKNPFNFLIQADLFVSTSTSESYGLAIQEALILNVPVVAVNCPGGVETFDKRFGVLIENSAEKLSAMICELLTNPRRLEAFRKIIKENYPLESLYDDRMEKICELIESSVE